MQHGRLAMAQGDDLRAEHYIVLAMNQGLGGEIAVRLLVQLCIRGSRLTAALQYAQTYLRSHDENVDLRFLAATLRDALGQPALALRELARVLTEAPDFGPAHFLAADIFHRQGQDLLRARFHAERYLELLPQGDHAGDAQAMLEGLSERIPDDA